MKRFDGKVAVVTGAASGIGRALALELAQRGAQLAISDLDATGLAATVVGCETAGAQVLATALDVTDRDAMFAYADEVASHFGSVNLVINNAGVALAAKATGQTMDDLDFVMGADWWGVAHGTQAFLPKLVASGDGALVNISSIFGMIAVPGQSGYNAAKFAVRGYTESIAQEALMDGLPVSVHCVHPGGIRTNIARNARTTAEFDGLTALFDTIARTSPEACARVILKGVTGGKRRILVGTDAKVLHLLQQSMGVRGLDLIRFGMTRLQQQANKRAPTVVATPDSEDAREPVTR
jgi:NAD(P)-dependent dehydrogenase (short-subunit alcohol dehydrogenase family)